MKNKVFAVIVCIVLAVVMAVPSTLALSVDTESSETIAPTEAPTAPETAPATEAPTEAPTDAPTEAPTESPTEAPTEEPTVPAEQPTEEPTEPPKECTCGAAEGEPHKEGCPLYASSVEIVHNVEGCTDDCTDEDCKCVCHLFKKIMECTTLDEIWAIMDNMTDEQWAALTETQYEAIDSLIAELDAAQIQIQPEEDDNPQIESEIIYPTVTYTYVAPFGEPVTGGNQ